MPAVSVAIVCPHCGGLVTPSGNITPRELEVLSYCMDGLTTREIALRVGIAYDTANNHLRNAYAKLGARNRTDAVVACIRLGLLDLGE